jgi:hypothetical protein
MPATWLCAPGLQQQPDGVHLTLKLTAIWLLAGVLAYCGHHFTNKLRAQRVLSFASPIQSAKHMQSLPPREERCQHMRFAWNHSLRRPSSMLGFHCATLYPPGGKVRIRSLPPTLQVLVGEYPRFPLSFSKHVTEWKKRGR